MLVNSFVKCWHPVAQVDQLTARGLERAFTYWRELVPMSERFKDVLETTPTVTNFEELQALNMFSKEEFETELNAIHGEARENESTAR